MLTVVGSFAFLYSCSDDDEDPSAAPTANVVASITAGGSLTDGGDVVAGETVEFTVNVTAEGGFNTLNVTGAVTESFSRNDLGIEAGTTTAAPSFNYVTDDGEIGTSLTFNFEAVDDENQTVEVSFSFNVVAPPSPDAKVQTAVLLYAPTGDENSETFYSIADDETYSVNEVEATAGASSKIDLGYFQI